MEKVPHAGCLAEVQGASSDMCLSSTAALASPDKPTEGKVLQAEGAECAQASLLEVLEPYVYLSGTGLEVSLGGPRRGRVQALTHRLFVHFPGQDRQRVRHDGYVG